MSNALAAIDNATQFGPVSYDGTPGRYIDVVSDVINAAYINFSAGKVVCYCDSI